VTTDPTSADYAIPQDVLSRRVNDEMVLLNMGSEQYYGLDPVGSDIVLRITSLPFDEAMAVLTADYEVAPEVLRSDVERLIGNLLEAGLLEPARRNP
jgi:hypothetical protein